MWPEIIEQYLHIFPDVLVSLTLTRRYHIFISSIVSHPTYWPPCVNEAIPVTYNQKSNFLFSVSYIWGKEWGCPRKVLTKLLKPLVSDQLILWMWCHHTAATATISHTQQCHGVCQYLWPNATFLRDICSRKLHRWQIFMDCLQFYLHILWETFQQEIRNSYFILMK